MGGKKSRTEPAEANLIPEEVFLSSNPNPVTFGVQIPHMPDKTEWKLDGKTIRLTLPLTDQVSGTGTECNLVPTKTDQIAHHIKRLQ